MYIYKFSQLFSHADFPFQVIYVDRQPEIDFHNHDFHEVVLICAGCGMHETQSGKYPVKAGDILVVPKGRSHRYYEVENLILFNFIIDPVKIALPVMDAMLLSGFKVLTGRENAEAHFTVSADTLSKLNILASELEEELKEREIGYQFAATSIFMRIILIMAREYPENKADFRSVSGSDVFKLVEFMEKNLARRISMKMLAREIHVSEPTLFRHFRNYLGCTPNSYLLQLRVSKAAGLLAETVMSFDEIAFNTGFCDSNHFSKTFTGITGSAPSRYRRKFK